MRLPKTPSKLIKVALKDLAQVERSKKYAVNMGDWHQAEECNGDNQVRPCQVCFAGAVMARTLNAPMGETTQPSDFDDATENKLIALNSFRCGDVSEGLYSLEIPYESVVKAAKRWNGTDINDDYMFANVEKYEDNPKQFRKDMWKLVKKLEKVGL